ncbi:hypothetical protein COOONC_03888 [Cooperia oncophora]
MRICTSTVCRKQGKPTQSQVLYHGLAYGRPATLLVHSGHGQMGRVSITRVVHWESQITADDNERCVQIYSDHEGTDPTKDTQFQKWNDYYYGMTATTMKAYFCKKPALHWTCLPLMKSKIVETMINRSARCLTAQL